jgi:hypothetical protein
MLQREEQELSEGCCLLRYGGSMALVRRTYVSEEYIASIFRIASL